MIQKVTFGWCLSDGAFIVLSLNPENSLNMMTLLLILVTIVIKVYILTVRIKSGLRQMVADLFLMIRSLISLNNLDRTAMERVRIKKIFWILFLKTTDIYCLRLIREESTVLTKLPRHLNISCLINRMKMV